MHLNFVFRIGIRFVWSWIVCQCINPVWWVHFPKYLHTQNELLMKHIISELVQARRNYTKITLCQFHHNVTLYDFKSRVDCRRGWVACVPSIWQQRYAFTKWRKRRADFALTLPLGWLKFHGTQRGTALVVEQLWITTENGGRRQCNRFSHLSKAALEILQKGFLSSSELELGVRSGYILGSR